MGGPPEIDQPASATVERAHDAGSRFLIVLGALLGFSDTGELFNMFVFFELMSVSAYALTAFRIARPASL